MTKMRGDDVVVPCVGKSWQEDNNKPSNELNERKGLI